MPAPQLSTIFNEKAVTVQGPPSLKLRWVKRVGRGFCRHGTKLVEHYECRGTSYYESVTGVGVKAKTVTTASAVALLCQP